MNGIWHEGKWYPRTGYICRRCGSPVFHTGLSERGYVYQCFDCDEDLFGFEVVKAPPERLAPEEGQNG